MKQLLDDKTTEENIQLIGEKTCSYNADAIKVLTPPKYKSILRIGNLDYMCTKSFTEKQKQNWLENFGVEIIDCEEKDNEKY